MTHAPNTATMQTTPVPRATDSARPRFETQPEPQQQSEIESVEPEPHWELIIDSATD